MVKDYNCIIKHNESDEEESVIIRLDPNYDYLNVDPVEDEHIFFYVTSWEALQELGQPNNGEDFRVLRVTL